MKNILITRTDRIGDVVLSLPVAYAIKAAHPECHVTFLVATAVAPIVQMCPWVDDCLTLGPESDAAGIVHRLRQRRFDAAVCLYPRPHIASWLKQAGIPVRVGTSRRWYSYRFSRRVSLHRAGSGRHERDLNLQLLRGLGIDRPAVSDPLCVPPQNAIDAACIILKEAGIEADSYAVVHPGSGGSARNWRPERYTEVCRMLTESGVAVLVTGSQPEVILADKVNGAMRNGIASIAGRTDLPVLAAILQRASVFFGPSTGPMHLAAAVGTPVVALFGPVRTTEPARWGPLGQGHTVFVPPVLLCRCRVDSCRQGDCMDMIGVNQVADAVRAAVRIRRDSLMAEAPPAVQ